ncbi:diguanylate cyclase [uncultured Thiocystis sp.]|uniref:diguanylate cyclase domain-containing protein n=1 Tax=uncultured Thiocystis sp. TaxID=1202134 RepID=UPI0025DFFE4F|nr:diguanylate cyclase [uncultured Thiocystis sp.]
MKRIAVALSQALRASNIICRYGGEEFICLLLLKQDDEDWKHMHACFQARGSLPLS